MLIEKIRYVGAFIRYVIDPVRLALAIIKILAVYLLVLSAMRYQFNKDSIRFEAEIASLRAEQEVAVRTAVLGAVPEAVSPQKIEAEEIARVLYGTARNNTEEDQRLVVWCIINRMEHQSYPDTITEVCQQESQWMGYSKDNPVIESLYSLAYDELTSYYNGGYRPMPPEYVFLSWSEKEIVLKDQFEDAKGTHYWRS